MLTLVKKWITTYKFNRVNFDYDQIFWEQTQQ